ncbi:glucokinase [Hydrocarboniclastica marina]|uniref:Glucokinase n=1 Tax=Hydrocarboniclastica marina TaxID=2259620 RepID=A0A4P7XKS6_9ALTE|nr:glucokinase [Hydrocarboniclastica marina]QCF27839.1 glucokinase [Hydrocarboniclastica marina]
MAGSQTTNEPPVLVGDIGGTNARFALAYPGRAGLHHLETLQCADYDNLDAAATAYLARTGQPKVDDVCLAVASPIQGTRVEMTNNHWRFDTAEVAHAMGWRQFRVLNDFLALALGMPQVAPEKLVKVCGGAGDPNRARLVIGPGTGLGVAGLVPHQGSWIALPSQGGHVEFAPRDGRELAILQILQGQFGRVSAERILCGAGLVNLYRAHAQIEGVNALFESPGDILQAALASTDPLARKTLEHFSEIMGRVAGDAALTMGSLGGVYLCGGIIPRFVDFFCQSGFQKAFEDKGRMRKLMEQTPVHIVTEPYAGLLGAAEALRMVDAIKG